MVFQLGGNVGDARRWGYSVKTPLAASVDEQVSNAVYGKKLYFAYFTREFNPLGNNPASNPLEIFKILDEAVKREAPNHPKIIEIRMKLSGVVISNLTLQDHGLMRDVLDQILNAPLSEFQPQLWKIDLTDLPVSSYTQVDTDEFRSIGYSIPLNLIWRLIP